MNDLEREKLQGFSWWYLKDVLPKKKLAGTRFHTPGFGLAAQLFASFAKEVLDRMGPEQGEAVIRQAVQHFGKERGKSIAKIVEGLGKPLSFKNWLIYSDIASDNFGFMPTVDNTDLVVKVRDCTFIKAARQWGLGEYGALYCKYADHAILEGYNPHILLKLETRHDTGKDYCVFRYIMNQANK
ncbi:MAG: L-2-amino-thiazoline-4-carboxylic acid hydrolase [Desulfatibacillum sp.]|nr:L-2-amino-thiazoline-4-carboxylic acid hydrolase [Desulfatibacillum sp.]